jgi:hypothetical protein
MENRMTMLFASVHQPVVGTKLPTRDVCYPVATWGKPDMAQKAQFGSD